MILRMFKSISKVQRRRMSGSSRLVSSPRSTSSILMTSALPKTRELSYWMLLKAYPRSASNMVAVGAARTRVRSTILIPFNGGGMPFPSPSSVRACVTLVLREHKTSRYSARCWRQNKRATVVSGRDISELREKVRSQKYFRLQLGLGELDFLRSHSGSRDIPTRYPMTASIPELTLDEVIGVQGRLRGSHLNVRHMDVRLRWRSMAWGPPY